MKKIIAEKWSRGLNFVIAMWCFSRLAIIVAMQLIAPIYPLSPTPYGNPKPPGFVPNFVPKMSWELFSHWDGAWYQQIVTSGYEYANDGQSHSVAFFPLFPLITRAVMALGLPFEVAGTLVNNLAFLGALLLLYRWAKEHHGISAARWVTAVMVWCPFSLFGTVAYTEGLFMLLTAAALRAFEKRQHTLATVWGALATASRANALALIPTFIIVAWKEKRPAIAYAAALATASGIILFSLYCAIKFADPLAFVRVQKTFHGIGLAAWFKLFKNPFSSKAAYGLFKLFALFGSSYLFWKLRNKLSRVAVIYGFFSLALILVSTRENSVGRYVYAIVSLFLALGVLLSKHPRWGYATLGLFAIFLLSFSIRFSWWYWVA